MNRRPDAMRPNAGAALIAAIGMLLVFSLMGAAYLGYMLIEWDSAQDELTVVRSRQTAEAGVQAAIATIGRALAQGADVPARIGGEALAVPLYRPAADGEGLALDEGRSGRATVTVADECARVNLNFAPTPVLAAVLGITPDAARAIRFRLPRIPGDDSATDDRGARWLTSVDELQTRGLVEPGVMDRVNKDLLTVYSVGDPAQAAGFINVNTASPEVLAAVLDLSPEAAVQVRENALQTPFASVEALAAAAGKGPEAFHVKPAPDAPGSLPRELSFTSRCFRIVSEGVVQQGEETLKGGTRIEAVILFDGSGRPHVRYWNETRGVGAPPQAEAPAEPDSAPAA